MKKVFYAVMAVAALAAMTACGGKKNVSDADSDSDSTKSTKVDSDSIRRAEAMRLLNEQSQEGDTSLMMYGYEEVSSDGTVEASGMEEMVAPTEGEDW